MENVNLLTKKCSIFLENDIFIESRHQIWSSQKRRDVPAGFETTRESTKKRPVDHFVILNSVVFHSAFRRRSASPKKENIQVGSASVVK